MSDKIFKSLFKVNRIHQSFYQYLLAFDKACLQQELAFCSVLNYVLDENLSIFF